MNLFQKKTTWTNTEFITLKLCIATAYLLIGGYFHKFVSIYRIPILIVFVITMIWSVLLWLSKMKKENR
jgi:predicted neutral ceramidase superfamily lipid hydrolase